MRTAVLRWIGDQFWRFGWFRALCFRSVHAGNGVELIHRYTPAGFCFDLGRFRRVSGSDASIECGSGAAVNAAPLPSGERRGVGSERLNAPTGSRFS